VSGTSKVVKDVQSPKQQRPNESTAPRKIMDVSDLHPKKHPSGRELTS
jgi:hypothetical protein